MELTRILQPLRKIATTGIKLTIDTTNLIHATQEQFMNRELLMCVWSVGFNNILIIGARESAIVGQEHHYKDVVNHIGFSPL